MAVAAAMVILYCADKRTHTSVATGAGQGTYGDTPLCLLAAKAETTTKEVLTQRRMAAVFLIETGVDFGMKNGKGLTAIQVACRDCTSTCVVDCSLQLTK